MQRNARIGRHSHSHTNERSHIPALSNVFAEPQVLHELIQDARGILQRPVLIQRCLRTERIPRQRRHDDVVRQVLGRVLVPNQLAHGQELDEAAGPPVHEDDGHGIFLLGEECDEMQVDVLNLHSVVGEGIDVLFLVAPRERVQPVVLGVGEPFVGYAVVFLVLGVFEGLGAEGGEFEELAPGGEGAVRDVDGVGFCGGGGCVGHVYGGLSVRWEIGGLGFRGSYTWIMY